MRVPLSLFKTSDVIAGIQWTVANRVACAIKLVNLSLGHPQVEPCLGRSTAAPVRPALRMLANH